MLSINMETQNKLNELGNLIKATPKMEWYSEADRQRYLLGFSNLERNKPFQDRLDSEGITEVEDYNKLWNARSKNNLKINLTMQEEIAKVSGVDIKILVYLLLQEFRQLNQILQRREE